MQPRSASTAFGLLALLAGTTLGALLPACSGGSQAAVQRPVVIRAGDMCATCGMYIEHYPGPRAEAYVAGRAQPLKFGSTRDFFAYILQPDHASQIRNVFVQDAARIDWQHPSDAADSFVDARMAYYVAWQPLQGEMGPTFASFARPTDAAAFTRVHGGQVLRFGQITEALVSALGDGCPAKRSAAEVAAAPCTRGPDGATPGAPNPQGMAGMH